MRIPNRVEHGQTLMIEITERSTGRTYFVTGRVTAIKNMTGGGGLTELKMIDCTAIPRIH